jgi:hypothetical protein
MMSIQVCDDCVGDIRRNLADPRAAVCAAITDMINTYLPTIPLDEIVGSLRQEIQRRCELNAPAPDYESDESM